MTSISTKAFKRRDREELIYLSTTPTEGLHGFINNLDNEQSERKKEI